MRIRLPERAARRLAELVDEGLPPSLPTVDRWALRTAAVVARGAPGLVMPLVRRRVKAESAGVVLPAEAGPLGRHIAQRRRQGIQLNVNLLGEAILGEDEARRRLEGVRRLVARPDVDYVSVKLSSISSRINPLAFEATVDEVTERLRPLYDDADRTGTFVNLDMEEYRDLWLTVAVFRRMLDDFPSLDAGIVLQAYLPDSHAAMAELAGLGPRVKVRVVKGANLAMERVDAELHAWPQAPYDDKGDVDASYKRLLDTALAGSVRIGVASHNLFDVAWGLTVARRHDALDRIDIEMLEGMAPGQAAAAQRRAPGLRLYAPVVPDGEFDAAIAYLARRLEENTQPGNFLREVFDLVPGSEAWQQQERRFRAAVAHRHTVSTSPRRRQDRHLPAGAGAEAFENEPDTDFALAANRGWVAEQLETWAPIEWQPADLAAVERTLAAARAAAPSWAATSPAERAALVRRAGASLSAMRGRLLVAMVHEAGKVVAEADPEVSEAVDFASFYASCAAELESLSEEGLVFEPYAVTVVAPPWNFPVAIPAGGVFAALVAGSAVVLKPAPETVACGALVAEACWQAGIPRDLVQLLPCADDDAGQALITGADGVILTGSIDTARLFLSWKPTMRLHAETSGKNSIVVTAAADLDAAVRDIVRSAFGHAGQKCSAASLVICEAAVHDDPRFLRQIADATRSLVVGPADDLRSVVGPLIHPPEGPLRRALHTLDPGETWLVAPEPLDEDEHLWRPGIRLGVAPGSWFHRTECFGPVLGVMRAPDLDTAIEWQNAVDFGLTGGIHSLDRREVAVWLERVQAGNCYVNRHVTGAIVRRQPFGGWKASSVGPTVKAGGPSYVLSLGRWRDGGEREVEASYRHWWETHYSVEHDPSGLVAERNVLRYRPLPLVVLRTYDSPGPAQLAASITGTPVIVSSADDEDDDAFAARLAGLGATRVRIIGTASAVVYAACHEAGITVDDAPVTGHGRVELLRWVREQAISETTHRYGNVRR